VLPNSLFCFFRHVIICSSNGVGCSGQVAVRLTWHNLQQIHPHIAIDLDLNPLQLQLHPHHLPLLSKVAGYVGESSQHAQHDGGNAMSGGVSSAQQDVGFVAGARSYVESAILPNFEQLAQDVADQLSWNTTSDPAHANSYSSFATPANRSFDDLASSKGAEFHDAHSMMGSVRTTFNSFLSSTAASLGSSQQFQPASSVSSFWQPPQTSSSSPPQQGSPNLRAGPKPQKADPGAGLQQNAAKPEVPIWSSIQYSWPRLKYGYVVCAAHSMLHKFGLTISMCVLCATAKQTPHRIAKQITGSFVFIRHFFPAPAANSCSTVRAETPQTSQTRTRVLLLCRRAPWGGR